MPLFHLFFCLRMSTLLAASTTASGSRNLPVLQAPASGCLRAVPSMPQLAAALAAGACGHLALAPGHPLLLSLLLHLLFAVTASLLFGHAAWLSNLVLQDAGGVRPATLAGIALLLTNLQAAAWEQAK